MTEREYLISTNLTKIRAAYYLLRDTMEGFDGVVTKERLTPILNELYNMQEALSNKIRIRQPRQRKKTENE